MLLRKFRLTLFLLLIGFLLAVFVVWIGGGGRGSNRPLLWLFPWIFTPRLWGPVIDDTWSAFVLLCRFPIYGLLLDLLKRKVVFLLILLFHLLMVLIIYYKGLADY